MAVTDEVGVYSDAVDLDRRSATNLLVQAAILFAGALSCWQIANVTVTGLSVICLMVVPAFLLMKHDGVQVLPLALAALAWLSFAASGLINHASPLWPNAVAPAAFALYLMGITVMTGRRVDLTVTLLAGICVGTVGYFCFEGIELTDTGRFADFWKYGIAYAVTIIVLYGQITFRLPVWVPAVTLALLGLISLGLNFRSHALVCILAAATLMTRQLLGTRLRRSTQFLVVLACGVVFAYLMPVAARAGLFGAALQQKTIEQGATELPLIMAGRTEPPMSITAILERPLLGWGSAQNLTPDLYTEAQHFAVRLGYDPTFPFDLYWRLPVSDYSAMHSILLGTWAEGGLLAVFLPLFLLVACISLVWNNDRFGRWAPIVLTTALQGIWDLVYAPWTYNMIPVYVCIAILFTAGRRGGQPMRAP